MINKFYKKLIFIYLLLILTTIFYSCNKYFPVKTITYNEYWQDYKVEVIAGQVILMFDKSISHTQAVQEIIKYNGKIISQTVDLRYYLINTGIGNEINFINQLKNNPNIKYIFFNAVEYPCKIEPQTYVLDNFYISHGKNVSYVLKECGLPTKINAYNVGIKGDEEGRISWSEMDKDLISILSFPPNDVPLIINMSFGPGFIDPGIDYWTDKEITDEVKNNYIKQYKEGLKHIIAISSEYKDKDFIIVKAAGNEGLKQLDTEILINLEYELTNDELDFLDKHFLLVGAEDKRNTKYSNTVVKGNYNFIYSTVDISDLKNNDENLYGTSFAAPRVSCFISSAVNENNIKATEVLNIIKDITRKNPDLPITQNLINKEVKLAAEKPKKDTLQRAERSNIINTTTATKTNNSTGNTTTKTTNTDNYSEKSKSTAESYSNYKKNPAGTVWKLDTKESRILGLNVFLEFKNNGDAVIRNVHANDPITGYPLKEPYIEYHYGTFFYEIEPLPRWVLQYYTEKKLFNTTTKVEHKAEIILQETYLILGWLGTNLYDNYARVK
jgi:hypothetical protein